MYQFSIWLTLKQSDSILWPEKRGIKSFLIKEARLHDFFPTRTWHDAIMIC